MNYFDFHTHVLLKQLLGDHPDIDLQIDRGDVKLIPALCSDLPTIIESQIDPAQLIGLNSQLLIGVALYGLESYLAAAVDPLRSNLRESAQYKLSHQLLQDIAKPGYTTFTSFTRTNTFDRYLGAPNYFRVIDKTNSTQPLETGKVNIFFVVEGCHSLVDSKNRVNLPAGDGYDPAEILRNLDVLLQQAPVLSVNLTHLQQSNLCNHAFGMQIADPANFYPGGCGFSDAGRTVVQGLFDRGICVDLKHMSWYSREQLRDEIDAGKYTNPQPLLCTHAGFTGTSFTSWPGFIRVKKPLNPQVVYLEITRNIQQASDPARPGAPAFNLSTINLMDEEIVWMVRNKGMIGLSMDRRILGFVSPFDTLPTGVDQDCPFTVDREYLSASEWKALNIADGRIGQSVSEDNCELLDEVIQSTGDSIPLRNSFFYAHVLVHLKHFLQVCIDAGIPLDTARKHICIGSDFDGIINPFLNFQTCEDIPGLKTYIRGNFKDFLASLRDSAKWCHALDIDSFVEDLFFGNGYAFVSGFFGK